MAGGMLRWDGSSSLGVTGVSGVPGMNGLGPGLSSASRSMMSWGWLTPPTSVHRSQKDVCGEAEALFTIRIRELTLVLKMTTLAPGSQGGESRQKPRLAHVESKKWL